MHKFNKGAIPLWGIALRGIPLIFQSVILKKLQNFQLKVIKILQKFYALKIFIENLVKFRAKLTLKFKFADDSQLIFILATVVIFGLIMDTGTSQLSV